MAVLDSTGVLGGGLPADAVPVPLTVAVGLAEDGPGVTDGDGSGLGDAALGAAVLRAAARCTGAAMMLTAVPGAVCTGAAVLAGRGRCVLCAPADGDVAVSVTAGCDQ